MNRPLKQTRKKAVRLIGQANLFSTGTYGEAFDRMILQSEMKRTGMLLGLLIILFGLVILLVGPLNQPLGLQGLRYVHFRFVIFTLLAAIFYELAAFYAFRYFLKTSRKVPLVSRYINALIETSIPTFVIAGFADIVGKPEALFSPPSYAYFFFILLSTLRLQPRLSVFTGVVAAVSYGALWWIYLPALQSYTGPSSLALPAFHITKILMYLIAGVVAGYVAKEIRRGMLESLDAVEERKKVVDMFGAHVSPEVVDKLLAQKTGQESEIRHVCVMFLDIRDFTNFSESNSPGEVVSYLNRLFEFMIESVNNNKGIINKFLGDGFMAVFGAPVSDGQDSRNAILASVDIIRNLDILNKAGAIPQTKIGIGLHTGDAVTGNVGSSRRKEYTIIGDTVNVASRIEQLNKKFESELLISDTVYSQALEKDPELLNRNSISSSALESIQVKGRNLPVQIHQLTC